MKNGKLALVLKHLAKKRQKLFLVLLASIYHAEKGTPLHALEGGPA